jgi:hypothetical protein
MSVEATEIAFYWSLPTAAIINEDLPGAQKARQAMGDKFPRANAAAIEIIDKLVKQLVAYEKAQMERETK